MQDLSRLSGVALSLLLAIWPAVSVASAATAEASPTALYVNTYSSSCSDSGPGSQAVPFCSIQAAANVVDPGQTVYIETASGKQLYSQSVTITRSGTPSAPITFARLGTEPIPEIRPILTTATPVTVSDVHDVSLSSLAVYRPANQDGIEVTGSSSVTLDKMEIFQENLVAPFLASISVDGTSSNITISRSEISGQYGEGVQVQPDAQGVIATTNFIAMTDGTGINLSGAVSSVITSNTVYLDCGTGVSVAGGSSVVAENNVLSVTSPSNAAPCTSPGTALSVAQDSVGTVRADHNALDAAAPNTEYSWAGTSYTGAAAFNAATGQGGHDLDLASALGHTPPEGSPVIDSADCTALGELNTDWQGNPRVRDPLVTDTGVGTCYADRGAFEREDTLDPTPTVITPSSLQGPVPFDLSVTLSSPATSPWDEPVSYTIDFGDGGGSVQVAPSSTTSHTYPTPGTYTLTVTAADTGGSTLTIQRQVVAGATTLRHMGADNLVAA